MEGMIDREALTRYVGRVLVLHDERKELNASISAVYEEAKSAGFVTGIIRQIVREKQMDAEERLDHYALIDTYRSALGMLADLPLGEAALSTASGARMPAPQATAPRPRPFAEQPVRGRGRGRPRKAEEPLDDRERSSAA